MYLWCSLESAMFLQNSLPFCLLLQIKADDMLAAIPPIVILLGKEITFVVLVAICCYYCKCLVLLGVHCKSHLKRFYLPDNDLCVCSITLGHIANKLPDSCQGFCFTCTMHGDYCYRRVNQRAQPSCNKTILYSIHS